MLYKSKSNPTYIESLVILDKGEDYKERTMKPVKIDLRRLHPTDVHEATKNASKIPISPTSILASDQHIVLL